MGAAPRRHLWAGEATGKIFIQKHSFSSVKVSIHIVGLSLENMLFQKPSVFCKSVYVYIFPPLFLAAPMVITTYRCQIKFYQSNFPLRKSTKQTLLTQKICHRPLFKCSASSQHLWNANRSGGREIEDKLWRMDNQNKFT